jgi:hypothetical protein
MVGFLMGGAAATAMALRAVDAGFDVAFWQGHAVEADPGVHRRRIETYHPFFAYLHEGAANEQRIFEKQV